ncbi:MAG TPA: hypothetical protein VK179_09410 [Bacteroidales bacterium]|nr:hypothetical protein [Bacteroidales bacterium]
MKSIVVFLSVILFVSCSKQKVPHNTVVDLTGTWQFATDTGNTGISEKWFALNLSDSIQLPGTTDEAKKGFLNRDTTTMHLNRKYRYEGPAWYRKKIVIPEELSGKHIVLFMERTKPSMVWVDGIGAGDSKLLQTPQEYDLSRLLTPGEHVLTIRINNDLKLTPYGNVHIYSDDTQTNWNGIIGKFQLQISDPVYIADLQAYPDISKKKVDVKLRVNGLKSEGDITLFVRRRFHGNLRLLHTKHYKAADSVITIDYNLGKECQFWDDYDQPVYELTAIVTAGQYADSRTIPFGMRKFSANGTQFEINGRTTFLRGKHDACVFPLTGHPPMDPEGWVRVFRIAKSYGINHYRFHSWCPPEAAFTAADRLGIFIQAELPFWGGLESDSIADRLKAEGMAMLKRYANHPSFVLFSSGNEIWSGHERVEKNLQAFKDADNRVLYAAGSNNNIGYREPPAIADFFVAARTPSNGDTVLTHTRLTHAFADSKDGGILNTQTPSTEINFDSAVSRIRIPMISHEIGQYQVFPDFKEIEKYTGVLEARNLEVFRKRLEKSGMMDQDVDFQKASGAWSALCYKAEMEAALRTKGLAGFQLLDLQDFPGQGTALVGILDAFMDDKEVIVRESWLQSCNDVVILPEFQKYCWKSDETFHGVVFAANYSNRNLDDALIWQLVKKNGEVYASGKIKNLSVKNGGLQHLGELNIDFKSIKSSEQLTLNIRLKKSGYSNSYPLWVYPSEQVIQKDDVVIAEDYLDENALLTLGSGGKVLLFPKASPSNTYGGLFPPEFWNFGMFKGISEWAKKPVSPGTLGILTDPDHPALKLFPTEKYTDWQWFSIIKAGHPAILDNTPKEYKPIVQVIDNLERDHKLGLVFEFRVGEGKLLVCMADLPALSDKPEAQQLYGSLVSYMKSGSFKPGFTADELLLKSLFQ